MEAPTIIAIVKLEAAGQVGFSAHPDNTVVILPSSSGPFETVCGSVVFLSERPENQAMLDGLRLLGSQVREVTG